MFNSGILPYFVVDSKLMCEEQNGNTTQGVLLPSQGSKRSRGWRYDSAIECYVFECDWPQNISCPKIVLQVHKECLVKASNKDYVNIGDKLVFQLGQTAPKIPSNNTCCRKSTCILCDDYIVSMAKPKRDLGNTTCKSYKLRAHDSVHLMLR